MTMHTTSIFVCLILQPLFLAWINKALLRVCYLRPLSCGTVTVWDSAAAFPEASVTVALIV